MIKQYCLNEGNMSQNFYVVLSPDIIKEMNAIYAYNQNNPKSLYQWYSYVEEVTNHISNRSIAWNYGNRLKQERNGAITLNDFDYNVTYAVKISKRTHRAYVYVYKIDLKIENFGLKNPFANGNNQGTITCGKLNGKVINTIITETINNYLRKNLLLAS